jgi:hypothetical protein
VTKKKDEKILVYKNDNIVNGSLRDHLLSRDTEPLSSKKRLEIGIGTAKGLPSHRSKAHDFSP